MSKAGTSTPGRKFTHLEAIEYLLSFMAQAVEEDAQCVYLHALATEDDDTTLRDIVVAATSTTIK